MNKWLYRTMGTVGVAGGFLLLGGTAAQAEPAPQPLTGVLGDLLNPTNGQTGPLGGNPASGLMPGDDIVPGVIDGPYLLPPPSMETSGNVAGDRAAGRAPADDVAPGFADQLPVGPAASVISPLPPAGGGGGLPMDPGGLTGLLSGGNLLPGGDLLSGSGLAPISQLRVAGVTPRGQVPAVIGDEMTAARPELFSPDLSLLGGEAAVPAHTLPATASMPAGGTAVPPRGQPVSRPKPAAKQPAAKQPAAKQPAAKPGRAFSDGRPVAGEDAEYR